MTGRILSASVRRINKSILYVHASVRPCVCVRAQMLEPTVGPGMIRNPQSLNPRGKGPCCPSDRWFGGLKALGE
jgi:hypothetical protein